MAGKAVEQVVASLGKVVASLSERIDSLEKRVSVDRFAAEQERTRRENKKELAKAERLIVRVSVQQDGTLLLAENIKDPVKLNGLVKHKVIHKIVRVDSPYRGKWTVNRSAINRGGYMLIEVKP